MIVGFEASSDDIVMTLIGPSKERLDRNEVYARDIGELSFVRFEVRTIGRTRGVQVIAIYDNVVSGCWTFAYGPLEEARPMPPWDITIDHAHAHSMKLFINTLDDVVEVREVKRAA